MALRLVMMGTGSFALPTFLGLYETQHTLVGLFTQPDRTGRGHHRHVNVMKQAAGDLGIPVFGPQNVNTPESLNDLKLLNADLCVVAAYGQILAENLLRILPLGFVNVHASLLPKYRGAAPIAYAISAGETETGISIFQIDPKLDAGPLLGIEKIEIGSKETAGELEQRLAELAVPLTCRIVDEIEAGTTRPIPQNPAEVTRAPRIRKSLGEVDWTRPAVEIARHMRAMSPWPTSFTFLKQNGGKLLRLILLDVEESSASSTAAPGTLVSDENERLIVQTGQGAIEILRLRPEGKRAMSGGDFLRGHTIQPGDRFVRQSPHE